jgi:hypothetical protein
MQSKIPAQELARALFELITQAKEQEPLLAKWLIALTTWIRDWDSGRLRWRLRSKKYLLAVLTEISIFAERWLLLKQLDPELKEQFLEKLNPAERYYIQVLFPLWLKERNPKLTIWKKKLMSGKLEPSTARFNQKLYHHIQQQGGYSIHPLLTDWWMNTTLVAGFRKDQCLCVQLTTACGNDLQDKLIEWEKVLWHCGINRGLLISYDPNLDSVLDLADLILSASKTLGIGQYRTLTQDPTRA